MNLISYPTIKQYFWYHKKLNTEYFGKVLPILHVKYKYHIYYTDTDLKSFKKVNLYFPSGESCEFEKKVYYVGTFTNENHDDIISKLRKIYNIVYIDIDDNLIWSERKNETSKHNFFDKLMNFSNYYVSQEPFGEFVVGINMSSMRIASPVSKILDSTEQEMVLLEAESEKQDPASVSDIGNTAMSIIENYYFIEPKEKNIDTINIIAAEIINGTGIKKHQEVFDGDDFIIIEANEADL